MTDDASRIGAAEPTDAERDVGTRPSFAKPIDERRGKIGTGDTYSGQEYDAPGQADWRARQKRLGLPEDGAVEGSGAAAGDAETP